MSIVSYNHLGNNDGMNLSAPQTFRSKEISKSNVVDDMVASNGILFEPGEHPDHVVVIKVTTTIENLTIASIATVLCKIAREPYVINLMVYCCVCSMCHMLGTAREPWMSTPLRYSWVGKAPLCFTTLARTLSWPLRSFSTWSSSPSLALASSSKPKERYFLAPLLL